MVVAVKVEDVGVSCAGASIILDVHQPRSPGLPRADPFPGTPDHRRAARIARRRVVFRIA